MVILCISRTDLDDSLAICCYQRKCILQLVCKWLPAVSPKEGAAQEPHDYFGVADCSALIGSAAPDLPYCNIDVAAGLKPRVYDCIGFYCHLKEILGQRLRDMQIQRGRSCDSLQSVFPQVSCFQSLCLQFCLSGDTYGSGEQAHTFLQRSPSSLLLKTFEGLPIRRKWF